MILFFDTETTGKADFRSPPDAPHQPRLVQLGAILTDDTGLVASEINFIVKPSGFEIPAEASSVHGFTTQRAIDNGFGLEQVLPLFAEMCRRAHVLVAHNLDFDELVMTGEFLRAMVDDPFESDAVRFCTMKATTDICKIPGPYGFKWPRLQEAFKHAFGKEFDGAHDAMADVRACRDLYFWIISQIKPVPVGEAEAD